MSSLARIAEVSPAHLHRLFRAEFNTTPQQYRLRFAMRQAQLHLLNSTRTCREIATDLGFAPLYFSTAFRRVVGVSPSEFRRRHG
jgi:AraC-like DNA-binding protein